MKSRYRKLKFKIVSLLVVVVLLGSCAFICLKAMEIREEYMEYGYNDINEMWRAKMKIDSDDYLNDSKAIKYAYKSMTHISGQSEKGFYAMLKDKEGNTLANTRNFVIVTNAKDNEDFRIISLGDEVLEENKALLRFMKSGADNVKITGVCDDCYIYVDTIKFYDIGWDKSYIVKINEAKSHRSGTEKIEDWAGANIFNYAIDEEGTYWLADDLEIGGDTKRSSLNAEAKKIAEKKYDDLVSGRDTNDYTEKEGLFKTYVACTCYSENYQIPCAFVIYPIQMAVEEMFVLLLAIFIMTIIAIILIVRIINRLSKQQEKFERNRSDFIRGIAHELKTPLAVARAYVENWAYVDENEKAEYGSRIVDEIDRMTLMVNDFLELSRLEAKVKSVNIESVDLLKLTESVLNRLKPLTDERGLCFSLVHEGAKQINSSEQDSNDESFKEYLVKADLEMTRTVIMNFVTNAIKYAKKNIVISIKMVKNKITFYISNDGETIPEDKIETIWDIFYKTEDCQYERIGNSGIGLAIAKNILILHKAKYGCDSKEGKTTFWFEMKKEV